MSAEVGKEFAAHKTVEHGSNGRGYYVGKDGQTTNAAENFFGIFKRGMVGTYHKCEAQHLQRYLTEFEFRHNTRACHRHIRWGTCRACHEGH